MYSALFILVVLPLALQVTAMQWKGLDYYYRDHFIFGSAIRPDADTYPPVKHQLSLTGPDAIRTATIVIAKDTVQASVVMTGENGVETGDTPVSAVLGTDGGQVAVVFTNKKTSWLSDLREWELY
ncbi:hypothetical protein RI367_008205 [Sorochytrium milnesiophthora]